MVHYRRIIGLYGRIIVGLLLALSLLVGVGISASYAQVLNPVVTITVSAQLPYPAAPTNFTITQIGPNSINLTWTKGFNATTTVIRVSNDRYVTNVTDGYEVYNGNGTSVALSGLTLDTVTYYYSAWSWNSFGYSINYARAKTGGAGMEILIFGILPLGFLGLFLWKRLSLLAYGSAATWALFAFFAFERSSSPDPAHIQDIYMGLFWLCIAFVIGMALFPLAMREKKEPEEIYVEELDQDLENTRQNKRHTRNKPSKFAVNGKM